MLCCTPAAGVGAVGQKVRVGLIARCRLPVRWETTDQCTEACRLLQGISRCKPCSRSTPRGRGGFGTRPGNAISVPHFMLCAAHRLPLPRASQRHHHCPPQQQALSYPSTARASGAGLFDNARQRAAAGHRVTAAVMTPPQELLQAPPRKVTVAATQMACSWDIEDNMVCVVDSRRDINPACLAAPPTAPPLPLPACRLCRRRRQRGWCAPPQPRAPTSSCCRCPAGGRVAAAVWCHAVCPALGSPSAVQLQVLPVLLSASL